MKQILRFKFLASLTVIFICIGSVLATRYFRWSGGDLSDGARDLLRSRGKADAPLRVLEYVDYQCQACREANKLLEDFMLKNPSKAFWQVRFFPLKGHHHTLKAAIYADCASRHGKFWAFQQILFDTQAEWGPRSATEVNSLFEGYARKAGLSTNQIRGCVDDPHTQETILAEKKEAKTMGIRETPTFFINGKMIVGLQMFKEEIASIGKTPEKKK